MTYIQRLLASAAPAPALSSGVAAPANAASSPVIAADQRLGIFPGLVDPFAPAPSGSDPAAETSAPVQKERVARPDMRARPVNKAPVTPPAQSTVADPPAPREPTPPPVTPAAPDVPEAPPPAQVSALQRLVEMDPLPPSPGRTAGHPADPPSSVTEPAPARHADTTLPAVETHPTKMPAAAALPQPVNPTFITPDQFTPLEPAPVADPATPDMPDMPDLPSPTPQSQVVQEVVPAAPAQPEPLQPAPDQGPSPFARQPDLPPAPPAQPQAVDPPSAERIVERIREVEVAPAPPPKAMTAAAQSVIGPLLQRRQGWRPRQGGV